MFRTVFSSKFITAVISDSAGRIYLVPIIHTIGDYFITELNRTMYVFKIDGSQIKHYHGFRKNVFSMLFYDTRHYRPLNSTASELEIILKQNSLPKINSTLAKIFKVLGSKEKKEFKPHNIDDLLTELSELKDNKKKQSAALKIGYNYDDKVANVINFLKSLNVTEIVTPLKSISHYVQDELISTDPAFMGTVISTYQRTDIQHKIISNTPSLGKISMIKLVLFAVLVCSVIIAGYVMYEMGMFEGGNPLEGFLGISTINSNVSIDLSNDAQVQKLYPTGKSLKNAIDSGKVNYDELSPNVQSMVDSLE